MFWELSLGISRLEWVKFTAKNFHVQSELFFFTAGPILKLSKNILDSFWVSVGLLLYLFTQFPEYHTL